MAATLHPLPQTGNPMTVLRLCSKHHIDVQTGHYIIIKSRGEILVENFHLPHMVHVSF